MPLWPLFYNIAHYLNWKIQILETYGIQTEQNGTAYFAMLSFVAPLYEAQELSFNIYLRHTLATCQLPSEQKEIHNKYITISSVFYPRVKQSKRLLWYYYMTSNTHTHTHTKHTHSKEKHDRRHESNKYSPFAKYRLTLIWDINPWNRDLQLQNVHLQLISITQ